jgi:hypothetical protein
MFATIITTMAQTEMQKKMAKLRAMKGKPKVVGKPKKGGCHGKKCMCGCGKKAMCGEGRKLQAIARAAKKAAAVAKKAALLAAKHRKAIAAGVGAAAGLAGAVTGNETISTIGDVASALGEGKRGHGMRGGQSTTGELVSPAVHYPNSSGLYTGRLSF